MKFSKNQIICSLILLGVILLTNFVISPAQTPTPSPSATPPPTADEEILKVDTTLVSLPVSILNRDGKFIPNLKRNDFHIFENGVEQDIEYFAPIEEPFTVVLLIDRSDSVSPVIDDLKKAANSFIDQLRPNDRIVGVAFDRKAYILNTKVRDRDGLKAAINNMTTGTGTRLHEIVEGIINRIFKGLTGRKALLVLTDGQDAWDWDFPKGSIQKTTPETNILLAEETGTQVYTIQFDSNFRTKQGDKFMKDIPAKTGGKFFRADKLKDFDKVFGQIADELRFQYSIGYYPKNTPEKGERRQIKVKVNQPEMIVRARDSYVFAK